MGEFMEVGEVELSREKGDKGGWVRIDFTGEYKKPVVILSPASLEEVDPALVQLRRVESSGCEVRLGEWEYQDERHGVERVGYVVLETGRYEVEGQVWEAGKVKTGQVGVNGYEFLSPYGSRPVLLTQVVGGGESRVCRIEESDKAGFSLVLEYEEASGEEVAAGERVFYVAIESGEGVLGQGVHYEVGFVSREQMESGEPKSFANESGYVGAVVFGRTQERRESDPATLRVAELTTKGVKFVNQEEESADAEVAHAAQEVGYWVIGGERDQKDLDGDGVINEYEEYYGFNQEDGSDVIGNGEASGQVAGSGSNEQFFRSGRQ